MTLTKSSTYNKDLINVASLAFKFSLRASSVCCRGRNGLELAFVYLRSAKLGFICARVFGKRRKLPSISVEVKGLIFPFEIKELKGKAFEELSTLEKKSQ